MFAIICRRRLRLPTKVSVLVSPQVLAPHNAVFIKLFSSKISSSDVNGDDSKQSFTISYLINSCGLSSEDAFSVSKKVTIKSPENPDSVLELLRNYGFTNADIHRLVTRLPNVLFSCPKKTLLPKLEFFRSMGVSLDVLARNLSTFPKMITRSLENYLIPSYDHLKGFFKYDKRAVSVFKRAPVAFAHGWQRGIWSNIAILRERGIPESSDISLMYINHRFW
ncbi:hypothetical protein CDL12_22416 [Handroanthus impetiginosus]|uniref:Mitochondrial transcription termination factor, mTERF n=1 Tax=Handroanthus impetiginosus TaxID=429701 RepID=A0A2G9GIC4_9LAMI|nr:hypothetical protein CDL12_22416 [Handroanthus impetiginosus]